MSLRDRAIRAAFASLLLLPLLVGVASAVSTTIVISEFRVRGPNGGNDEFVELYNLSGSTVDISSWTLRGSNNAGTVSVRATVPASTSIGPGCHYLFTNSSTSGGPYSGSVTGNQTYATGFTDDGGIAIANAAAVIIDQVGMSAGSAYKEGTPLASLGTNNLDQGYERKPGGTSGSGTDTDNNSADFQLLAPSAPQNAASACIVGACCLRNTTPGACILTTPSDCAAQNGIYLGNGVACDAGVCATGGLFRTWGMIKTIYR